MQRRVREKKEMIARLSEKEYESPRIEVYETHYERLNEKYHLI